MSAANPLSATRAPALGLARYISLARKWLWLIVLAASLGALGGFLFARTIPPTYRSTTTMLIGQLRQNATPTDNDIQASTNLAAAYALLVQQPRILEATAKEANYSGAWQDLYYAITTAAQPQMLRISVTDRNPQMAQAIANAVAQQLIVQGPAAEQQSQASTEREFVQAQLNTLRKQILASQQVIDDLTARVSIENDPDTLRDLNARIVALQEKVDAWQKNYASLSALLNQGGGLYVTVLAPANLPTGPVSPIVSQYILLGAFFGLLIACALIFVFEYADDTIKDADDAQRVLGRNTLGAIVRIHGMRNPVDALVTLKKSRSPIAEAYRVLRTNLRFSGIENPGGVMLVTSAGPGEGKSTTAANLAVSLAQIGKRIVLVDADLRRPSVHKMFEMDNAVGLSDLFGSDGMTVEQVMQPTAVPTLRVIPSGPIPPNPAELLDSRMMTQILSALRQNTDMVIVDSPPVLPVADASILGTRCSGAVLVVDAGKTRTDSARRALATLERANVKVAGVILNKLGTKQAAGYYYYYYDQKKN